MRAFYKRGDLVHIPQAVKLYQFEDVAIEQGNGQSVTQLGITRYEETKKPEIGVITAIEPSGRLGYLRIYCSGDRWAVEGDNVFPLKGEVQ
jgi:hypothetical protein